MLLCEVLSRPKKGCALVNVPSAADAASGLVTGCQMPFRVAV